MLASFAALGSGLRSLRAAAGAALAPGAACPSTLQGFWGAVRPKPPHHPLLVLSGHAASFTPY
jgi:hypothetical protein